MIMVVVSLRRVARQSSSGLGAEVQTTTGGARGRAERELRRAGLVVDAPALDQIGADATPGVVANTAAEGVGWCGPRRSRPRDDAVTAWTAVAWRSCAVIRLVDRPPAASGDAATVVATGATSSASATSSPKALRRFIAAP
jgi:hypothetical protein